MSDQHVYQAIAAITAELSKEGIAKGRKNQQQGYAFRGIDDVYGALAHHLATNKLCIIPRCIERIETERASKSGGALFSVAVAVEFDLVSAVDGSKHTARMYGEAMDSADKATNKAMSAAYKYMALEVFCIPTEGDNDADAQTHEVAGRSERSREERGGTSRNGLDRDDQGAGRRGAATGQPLPAGAVTLDSIIPFGKHKDKTVREAGIDYFEVLISKQRAGEAKGEKQHEPTARFAALALKAFMPDMTTLPKALEDDDEDRELDKRLAAAEAK